MADPRSEQPKRAWWRFKPRLTQDQPANIQFDRAARWLRNQARHGKPPPGHIAKQIRAQRVHLQRGGLL